MSMKKVFSIIMSVVMILSVFTGFAPRAYAADGVTVSTQPVEGSKDLQVIRPAGATVKTVDTSKFDLPEPDALFAEYVDKAFSRSPESVRGMGSSTISGEKEALVYSKLSEMIKAVADGERASTVFELSLSDLGILKNQYTAEDLGVAALVEGGDFSQAAIDAMYALTAYDMDLVLDQLLYRLPYDLYWFDKTTGIGWEDFGLSYGVDSSGQEYVFFTGSHKVSFAVASEYAQAGQQYMVDTSVGETVQEAAQTARNMVGEFSSYSDYEKLEAYKGRICDIVSYNDAAAEDDSTPYGNPWQLIWVFDGDYNTNVVCEGYSKAFQYLCQLSDFDSPFVQCISVSGQMSGGTGAGPHMWNVVKMDDNTNYLVDITNCDSGSVGYPDLLFLKGASGSVSGGYTVSGVSYTYDDAMYNLYSNSDLELSGTDYEPGQAVDPGDNGFYAYAENYYAEWTPSSYPTLRVIANADKGELSYQWFKGNDAIVGATLSEYTVDTVSEQYTYFYCLVEDDYGHAERIEFQVTFYNEFYFSEIYPSVDGILAAPGSTLDLGAYIYTQYGGFRSEWSQYDFSSNEFKIISGASNSSYTVTVGDSNQVYRLTIYDDFGNSQYHDFFITSAANSLSAVLDETLTFDLPSGGKVITFVPDEDGYYEVLPSILTDESELFVNYEFGTIDGSNYFSSFSGSMNSEQGFVAANTYLEAGTTYYFCVYNSNYTDTIRASVRFQKHDTNGLVAYAAGTQEGYRNYYIALNESVELAVDAQANKGALHFQWFDPNGYEIENATSASFITGSINQHMVYRCQVTDDYNNSVNVWFYIYIDNGLKVYVAGTDNSREDYCVEPGSIHTLEISVEAVEKDGLSYQWYSYTNEYGDDLIEGETGTSFTTPGITEYVEYYCNVTDKFGNSDSAWFVFQIDNNFHAYAAGTEYNFNDLYVDPGEAVTLEVEVSATDMEGITYQWYNDSTIIPGATEASYTIPEINEYSYYWCRVTDKYGNWVNVSFNINIDNGLTAYEAGSNSSYVERFVAMGESLELAVDAYANNGELTYKWYKNRELIDGANTSSISTDPINGRTEYECQVVDMYGNRAYVMFIIKIDNELRAWDKDTGERDVRMTVPVGTSVSFEVEISAADTDGITYQWYKSFPTEYDYNEWRPISGATSNSYTENDITRYTELYCEVRDQYDNYYSVNYQVQIDNGLRAYVEGTHSNYSRKYVDAGQRATFTVEAYVNTGELHYQWYEDYNKIEGATSATFETPEIGGFVRFICRVSDDYDKYKEVYFEVSVNNNLRAWDKTSGGSGVTKTVAPGETLTLEVEVSATDTEGITYQWADRTDGWTLIEGATSASFTTPEIYEYNSYECVVTDKYGSTVSVYYYLGIENGLYAYPKGGYEDSNYLEVTVAPGDDAVLEVVAGADTGDLAYQWRDDNWEVIREATGASYTAKNVTKAGMYTCIVKDDYGNQKEVRFAVRIDNAFKAYAKGTKDTYAYLTKKAGETAVLEVTASANTGGFTYQWYKNERVYIDASSWWYDEIVISGATGPSYTTEPLTEFEVYSCRVGDEFGNYETVRFELSVDNGLYAYAAGTRDTYKRVDVEPGEDALLEVVAGSNDPDEVFTYNWHDEYGNYIDGATSSSYLIKGVTQTKRYYCVVTDKYKNIVRVSFYVRMNNELTAYPKDRNYEIAVLPNATAELEVIASVKKGSIKYAWYKNDSNGKTLLEGQTASKIVTEPVKKSLGYICEVSDDYGSTQTIYFTVQVDNGLYAVAKDGVSGFTIKKGESVEMAVRAGALNGNIKYEWLDPDNNVVDGASTATLKTGAISEDCSYRCVVTDDFGNMKTVQFYIYLENHFDAWAETPMRNIVEYNTNVKMKVGATADTDITYEWQKFNEKTNNWDVIAEAQKDNDTNNAMFVYEYDWYRCIIRDEEGHSKTIEFEIYVISPSPVTLELDKTVDISSFPEQGYAKFIPEETGAYQIESVSDSNASSCEIYYKDENGIHDFYEWNGFSGDEMGFYMNFILEKGVTYYFAISARAYGESSVSTSVLLRKHNMNGFTAKVKYDDTYNVISSGGSYYETVFGVEPGGSIVLQVEAHADSGKLHYEWWNYSDIAGVQEDTAEGSKYTISGITKGFGAECYVYDDFGNNTYVYIRVELDNKLEAVAKTPDVQTINENASATMTVEATAGTGNVYYAWFYGDSDDPVAGGNGPTLTVSGVKEGRIYYCRVTDDYGTSRTVYFTVAVAGQNDGLLIYEKNFQDAAFRDILRREYDGDRDGYLSKIEIANITDMMLYSSGIGSLVGIHNFTALQYLYAPNNSIRKLDLSKNTALRSVYVYNNALTELILGENPNLSGLYCFGNDLTSLDISGCPKLMQAYKEGTVIKFNGYTQYQLLQPTAEYSLVIDNNVQIVQALKTATVTGISLDLQDKISVQFKIQPDDNMAYAELSVQKPDGSFDTPVKVVLNKADTSVYKASEDKFVVKYSEITTKMITQGVKLTVYDKSGNVMNIYRKTNDKTYTKADPLVYSAADWCKAAIERYGTDKTQKAAWLAMAVLNLGGEAQKYFDNYNPGNPANPKGYLADDMASFTKNAAYNQYISDANAKKKGYSGMTLDLAADTRLRVKFTANVAVTVDGNARTLVKEGDKYVLDITGLRCIDLDQFFTVVFKGTDGSNITMRMCALSWSNAAYDALKASPNHQTLRLAKAVALYSAAAENYFK